MRLPGRRRSARSSGTGRRPFCVRRLAELRDARRGTW